MHRFGMLMNGRAQPTGIRRRREDTTLLMVLNAPYDLVEFILPETAGDRATLLERKLLPVSVIIGRAGEGRWR
jgi:hypothetical protein